MTEILHGVVMVINATFNIISIILCRSILPRENHRSVDCWKSLTNIVAYCCIEYTSPLAGIELTTLVVIDTDCTGSCTSRSRPQQPLKHGTFVSKTTYLYKCPVGFSLKNFLFYVEFSD